MNFASRNLTVTRRERREENAPPTPSTNGTIIAPDDMFETDEEGENDEGDTNEGYDDFSDEEAMGTEEAMQSIDGSIVLSDALSGFTGARTEETTNDSAAGSALHGKLRTLLGYNKLIDSLLNAQRSYSTRLRNPISTSVTLISTRREQTPSDPQPEYLREILSDEEDESESEKESGSSSDQYDDTELLSNRPDLDNEEAMQPIYRALGPWSKHTNAPIENPVVIATLHAGAMCEAYIKQGMLGGRMITYVSKTWLLSQKWEGFASELALYSDPKYLRPLQGKVIPTMIGVYLVEGAISIAMELPSSDFWVEASEEMSDHLKQKCISAYDKIHERGVLHNDVELRHMLINSRGNVTIIDFQESRAVKPVPDVGLKAATESEIRLEKRKVQFKLNYKNSRENEMEKIERVTKREEQKRQRLIRRRRRAAAIEQGKVAVDSDEESEPEAPDDVLNPIVDSRTWATNWIGEPFISTCYIVPGQDEAQVGLAIMEFVMKEVDRLSEDVGATRDADIGRALSTDPPEGTDQDVGESSTSSIPALATLTRTNSMKRGRDETDDSSDEASSPKKRLICPSESKICNSSSESRSEADSSNVDMVQPALRSIDSRYHVSSAFPVTRRRPAPDVYVPFEGYTEDDGYIIPNAYSPDELGHYRRNWIKHYNIKRAIEENLPYPLAEMEYLAPATRPERLSRIDSKGRKRKLKSIRNRGALIRRQIDTEDPSKRMRDAQARKESYYRNRKEPGTGLSDSEDGESTSADDAHVDDAPEGGKILHWYELEELRSAGYACSPYSSPSPSSSAARKGPIRPSKSVLRRQLTHVEKAVNKRRLEEYDLVRAMELDSDFEEENESQRARKRARASSDTIETQDAPNRRATASEFRPPSFLSFSSSGANMAHSQGVSTSATLASSDITQSSLQNVPSDARSQSTGIPSELLSDSESESDDDKEPSSSSWRSRRMRRRHRGPSDSDLLRRFGTGITLAESAGERAVRQRAVRRLQEIRSSAESMTGSTTVTKDESAWGWFRSKFSWPWPTSKR